jgi:hypothetical protein
MGESFLPRGDTRVRAERAGERQRERHACDARSLYLRLQLQIHMTFFSVRATRFSNTGMITTRTED